MEHYDENQAIEDYAVTIFLTKEGYFKKITPQSLRMSGEHKLKEGDFISQTFECSNKAEIIFLTNKGQAYKSRLFEFEDSKTSVLGDFLPAKLGFEEGESVIFAFLPKEYGGFLLYFFENGKIAKVALSGFDTKSNRKRLTGAFSLASPLVSVIHLEEDENIFVTSTAGRGLCFDSTHLSLKTTKTTIGVAVMTLKKNQFVEYASLAKDCDYKNISRYMAKTLPSAGALLRDEKLAESQISLIDN